MENSSIGLLELQFKPFVELNMYLAVLFHSNNSHRHMWLSYHNNALWLTNNLGDNKYPGSLLV